MSRPSGIECRDVRLVRRTSDGKDREILAGISARFEAGDLALITGAIGTGKTTLLHILSTILRPSSGEVLAEGEAVSRFAPAHRDLWRRRAGLAFQAPHFLEELDVAENVMIPLIPATSSLAGARARVQEELRRFDIAHLADRRLAGLSGGERARITLARALVGDPRFLFVDEPTAHQDSAGAERILSRLADARGRGATVIVVSHDPRLREPGFADRTWRLAEGRLDAES